MSEEPTTLGRAQFGKYLLTREQPSHEETIYNLWKQPEDSWEGAEHHGFMGISHQTPHSWTNYLQDNERKYMYETSTGTMPLFEHHSRVHAADMVDSLMMSKEARHVAPLMLGVAQHAAEQRTGRSMEASHDLSRHSERMVGRLKAAGAVPESHQVERHNNLSWSAVSNAPTPGGLEGLVSTDFAEHELVPKTEIETGRAKMRSILNQKQWVPPEERKGGPGKGQMTLF